MSAQRCGGPVGAREVACVSLILLLLIASAYAFTLQSLVSTHDNQRIPTFSRVSLTHHRFQHQMTRKNKADRSFTSLSVSLEPLPSVLPENSEVESLDNSNNFTQNTTNDTTIQTGYSGQTDATYTEYVPIIDGKRELTHEKLGLSSSIPVSYDENGIVYADAVAGVSSELFVNNSADEQDYPEFIKSLYRKDSNGQTLASKLFNFTLLAVSFGFVFFSVFNIDKGMTRGWSPSEIGMRIPLDTWASYENSLSEKPVATKTIINVVIYLLGDWLSQTLFQKNNVLDFDATRTIKNGLVGMCFGPAVHEYYEFSDWILPVDGVTIGITNRAFKILMDQTIYLSVKCSIYIIFIGLFNGDSLKSGTDNVKNRIKPIMFTAWKFWPLVHCVTYGLIPARHRILWVNSVDLVWNAILASKARDDDLSDDDEGKNEMNETK